MSARTRFLALALLIGALSLAACGGPKAPSAPSAKPAQLATAAPSVKSNQSATMMPVVKQDQPATSAPTTQPDQPATQAPLAAVSKGENGGETGGVEAALVTYADAAQGFSIGHPGPWTQDKSVTTGVKYVGGDDSLTLEFVTLPAGTDALAYATNDVAAVTTAFPGFQQLSLQPSTEVKDAIILGFQANGTSSVTGKSFTAHNERYYIPVAGGRLAVLTVVGPDNHYDREGVRDIALTLKVMK